VNGSLVPLHESARRASRERARSPSKVDLAAARILAGEAAADVRQDMGLTTDDFREAAARAYRPKSKLRPIRQPRVTRRWF
jgi:hypothetical protein